jgi:HMG (high mobility group) box
MSGMMIPCSSEGVDASNESHCVVNFSFLILAFLYFSQGRRRQIKEANPSMKNTEVSRLLGEMWRSACEDEKKNHVEKEKEEREKYKVAIADWRRDNDLRLEKERKTQAEHAAYVVNMYGEPNFDPHQQQQQYPGPDQNAIGPLYSRGGPSQVGPPPSQGQNYAYTAQQAYPYGKLCGATAGVHLRRNLTVCVCRSHLLLQRTTTSR